MNTLAEHANDKADSAHLDPARRHDFVLLFEVKDGNPNGDPDAGNLPRMDPETFQGLVSDVALKRRVRDYVADTRDDDRFQIYVQQGAFLSDKHKAAFEAVGLKKGSKNYQSAQDQMCQWFYDIRTFGAVLGVTDYRAGQVRGPVQITFARSIDPIFTHEHGIVRCALTNQDEERQSDDTEATGATHGTMARKATIPYGLFRAHGFYNPSLAKQTRFDRGDLSLLWEALVETWDHYHSHSRGETRCRGLYVFSHDNPRGNAHSYDLFERIRVRRKEGVKVIRSFEHYDLQVDGIDLPTGVSLEPLGE